MMWIEDSGELKTEWEDICNYLLHHADCDNIHKMVWKEAGEAFLTEKNGERWKITEKDNLEWVKSLIQKNFKTV